jgi:hypothetical protein
MLLSIRACRDGGSRPLLFQERPQRANALHVVAKDLVHHFPVLMHTGDIKLCFADIDTDTDHGCVHVFGLLPLIIFARIPRQPSLLSALDGATCY